MFNKFKYRNVIKMIAHFDNFVNDVESNPDDWVFWIDTNQLNEWGGVKREYDQEKANASLKKSDNWLAKLIRMGRLPKQNKEEQKQMQELLNEEWNGERLTRPELLALIRKYPPEILEEVLPCVMVMYLLRELNVDFDSDSKTFGKFFDGWHHMVICFD